ncbi:hypothetical protein [Kiloniella sp. EL199]|uniref:hypothetical protein n=1 Tax=Kiloniella sp. EL199 TaxID=2107581 RepID=UPI0013C52F00|nr:hypothetical protein [Kiloniella sp. EL199]
MNNNPLERVRSELIGNEQLIWADRPVSERFYRKKIKAAIAGKVIIGFIILWVLGVTYTSFSSGNMIALSDHFCFTTSIYCPKAIEQTKRSQKAR